MTVAPASPRAAAIPRPAPRVAPATTATRPRKALRSGVQVTGGGLVDADHTPNEHERPAARLARELGLDQPADPSHVAPEPQHFALAVGAPALPRFDHNGVAAATGYSREAADPARLDLPLDHDARGPHERAQHRRAHHLDPHRRCEVADAIVHGKAGQEVHAELSVTRPPPSGQ